MYHRNIMGQRLKFSTQFTAGVYYSGKLTMSVFYIKLWMYTNTDDSDEQNIAFDRIRYFINNVMSNTVFVEDDRVEVCRKLHDANISVTTVPSLPVDQVICLLLHKKLNAICEDRLLIVDTELSSDIGERVVYLHGEEENEGVAELEGWWHNSDLSHCDESITNKNTGRVVSLGKVVTWRDVHLSWSGDDSIVFESASNTVVFGNFAGDRDEKR